MYKTILTGFAALSLMAGAAALAQPAAASGQQSMHKNWQARRAAHMQKRLARFKSELKITSQQESAWNGYVKAMKAMHTPRKHKARSASSTPASQMFNRMADHASERAEHAKTLAGAVNTLYGELNSDQKKTFDKHFERMRARMHHHFKRLKRGHHGHHGHRTMHPRAAGTAPGA